MKSCAKCMRLRARFVRWLAMMLGVMEPQKETSKVEWNLDQLMSIIGNKEVEIIGLRMQVAKLSETVRKYEEKHGPLLEPVDSRRAA